MLTVPRTRRTAARPMPYLVLSVSTYRAINQADLRLKSYSRIEYAVPEFSHHSMRPEIDFEDEPRLGTEAGYRRTIARAYACKLPSFDDGPFECCAPNYDSNGHVGAHCLLPPAQEQL